MADINAKRQKKTLRVLLLLLAAFLSPLACCGVTYVLDILPSNGVPRGVDFMVNLFEAEVQVENRTEETLYITPVTTTTGKPVVIQQLSSIKQRDFPIKPDQSLVLKYDMADMPLAGITVCRTSQDCRFLATDDSEKVYLDTYDDLPLLEPEWLAAIQSSPMRNLSVVIYPILGFVPVILFVVWLYLTIKERKSENENPAKTAK